MAYAGMRPVKQNRKRPNGRASSIQPSALVVYSLAKARISSRSVTGSTPENKYAALPVARNDIALGASHMDMHATVFTSKSSSPASIKTRRIASANSKPCLPVRAPLFGMLSGLAKQVEQTCRVWRTAGLSLFRVIAYLTQPTSWGNRTHALAQF